MGWLTMVLTLPALDLQRGRGWNLKERMTLMGRKAMHPFCRGRSLQRDRRATRVMGTQLAFVMGSDTLPSIVILSGYQCAWPGALMITSCYQFIRKHKYSPRRQD